MGAGSDRESQSDRAIPIKLLIGVVAGCLTRKSLGPAGEDTRLYIARAFCARRNSPKRASVMRN
jgi:hypothetical protein